MSRFFNQKYEHRNNNGHKKGTLLWPKGQVTGWTMCFTQAANINLQVWES